MAILRQQSQALYFAIGLGSRLLRRAWLGWSLLCDCARVGLSLFQRPLCDIERFVHCPVSFLMKQLCRISSSLGNVSSSYQPPVRANCTRDRRPERADGGMCIFTRPNYIAICSRRGLSDC